MPTHSLYLTTTTPTNISTPLKDAIEYLPLTKDFNNYGNSNTLILTPSDTTKVTFLSDIPSVTFASNGYITSNNVTLQIPDIGISFCYWVYVATPANNGLYVTSFSIGDGSFTANSDCFKIQAYVINGTFVIAPTIYTSGASYTLSAYNGNVVSNKWIHICFTITPNTFTVYVDGVGRSSYNIPSPNTYSFRTLTSYKYIFGRTGSGNPDYFNGSAIREFARFNYALNATQINDIRNATLTASTIFNNYTSSLKPYNRINLNNVKWNINWREIFGNREGECRVRVKFVSQTANNLTWNGNTGSIKVSFASNYQSSTNGFNLGAIKPVASPNTSLYYLESDTTNMKGATIIIPNINSDLIISIFNGNETFMVNVPEYHIWLYFDVEN